MSRTAINRWAFWAQRSVTIFLVRAAAESEQKNISAKNWNASMTLDRPAIAVFCAATFAVTSAVVATILLLTNDWWALVPSNMGEGPKFKLEKIIEHRGIYIVITQFVLCFVIFYPAFLFIKRRFILLSLAILICIWNAFSQNTYWLINQMRAFRESPISDSQIDPLNVTVFISVVPLVLALIAYVVIYGVILLLRGSAIE